MSQLRTNSIVPAGGIPAGASGGGIIQIATTTITTEFTFSSSTYADATNFNLSITPRSTSNKVLVIMTPHVFIDNFNTGQIEIGGKIVRGSTDIFEVQLVAGYGGVQIHPVPLVYLDSPDTTSSTTYKLQVKASSTYNTSRINASTQTYATKSTITLMEISG
jgi:hypothetical protein